MAKKIEFEFDGAAIEFEMNKIDRSRLYGFKKLEVLDDDQRECSMATLGNDGKTLIGKGGTGIGFLDADGDWTDKTKLTAVNMEGEKIQPVPSSFSAPIKLERESSMTEFLNHNIRLIYKLDYADSLPDEVVEKLKAGVIFRFDYSFRGGLEPDSGFILHNEEGEIFFLVGDDTSVEFIGLQQSAAVTAPDDDPDVDDLMSFDMI